MFEGQDKCAICRCGISHHDSEKRADIDGVTHAFCRSCVSKAGDVERHLRLKSM